MVVCPACEQTVDGQCLESFRQASLYACPACDLHFWHPVVMPGTTWHELAYRDRDRRALPLEPGHRYFLSDVRAPQSGRLLDIGCGSGNFLAAVRAVNFDATGIELNQNAARFARETLGLRQVFTLRLEEFVSGCPGEKFDVVTFFEVLEHQDKPRMFLKLARACLNDGGYIALSVPNRERWQQPAAEVLDYPPNHLTRWNARALRNFLVAGGFEILTLQEEPLGVKRAVHVLSSKLRTGMVAVIAGDNPPTPSDLAEMSPDQMEAALHRVRQDGGHRLVSQLVRAKNLVMFPLALLLLPYLRLRNYKGLYLYCLARLKPERKEVVQESESQRYVEAVYQRPD